MPTAEEYDAFHVGLNAYRDRIEKYMAELNRHTYEAIRQKQEADKAVGEFKDALNKVVQHHAYQSQLNYQKAWAEMIYRLQFQEEFLYRGIGHTNKCMPPRPGCEILPHDSNCEVREFTATETSTAQ